MTTDDEGLSKLSHRTLHEGASERAITAIEKWVGQSLPSAYLRLMKHSNGLEGFVTEQSYLVLWPLEQLRELNEAYHAEEFMPGLLLIGSDGAETGYALDTSQKPMRVLEVPFVGMSHDEAKVISLSFDDFFKHLRTR